MLRSSGEVVHYRASGGLIRKQSPKLLRALSRVVCPKNSSGVTLVTLPIPMRAYFALQMKRRRTANDLAPDRTCVRRICDPCSWRRLSPDDRQTADAAPVPRARCDPSHSWQLAASPDAHAACCRLSLGPARVDLPDAGRR